MHNESKEPEAKECPPEAFTEAASVVVNEKNKDALDSTTSTKRNQSEAKKQGFGAVMRVVFGYAGTARPKMILSILCACVSVLGGFVPFYATYQVILVFFSGTVELSSIFYWIAIACAGVLVKIVFRMISTMLSHMSAYTILENLRRSVADRLMRAPLGTVLSSPVGRLKNIIVDRIETIELPLAHMIPEGISFLVLPILVFIYLAAINIWMALATLVCVPIGAFLFGIMMRDYNDRYEKFMQSSNHVNNVIVEYVEGIEVIKAFNQSEKSYEKYSKTIHDFFEFTMDWYRSTWKLKNLAEAVLPTTLLGALPVGILLYSQGAITPADLTMCMILALSIVAPITWFNQGVNYYKSVEYAIRDTEELLSLPILDASSEALTSANAKELESRLNNHELDLCFDSVSFSYDEDGKNVLHDINLTLRPDSFTALVGPSGGGKSTTARLAARFWDVGSGKITIGGVDIRSIPLDQLSSLVTYVTQDNFLFRTTLLENIRVGKPEATDEEVIEAGRLAQCEEFILRLDDGWNTDAGEAGKKLSGGERQRIAIARAILKDSPIVILDEATAFTDPENEDKIQRSLMELAKGKTLLVIAHRLATIRHADQIVVLNEGSVQEHGVHDSLIEAHGIYAEMWNAHIGTAGWVDRKEA
ncbi:MAG: ABC transporter ATP-binding protein [Raoultibacter sp.]|jgi:ATP-binding cassette subfamily B protein IrtA